MGRDVDLAIFGLFFAGSVLFFLCFLLGLVEEVKLPLLFSGQFLALPTKEFVPQKRNLASQHQVLRGDLKNHPL